MVDRDCKFVGAGCTSATTGFVISPNPSVAAADLTAPGAAGVRNDLYYFGSSTPPRPNSLSIDLKKGETIYVAASGAGSVSVFLT